MSICRVLQIWTMCHSCYNYVLSMHYLYTTKSPVYVTFKWVKWCIIRQQVLNLDSKWANLQNVSNTPVGLKFGKFMATSAPPCFGITLSRKLLGCVAHRKMGRVYPWPLSSPLCPITKPNGWAAVGCFETKAETWPLFNSSEYQRKGKEVTWMLAGEIGLAEDASG